MVAHVLIAVLVIFETRRCRNFVMCAIATAKLQRRVIATMDCWLIVDQRTSHGYDTVDDDNGVTENYRWSCVLMIVMIVVLATRATRHCRNFALCVIATAQLQQHGIATPDGWLIGDQRNGHEEDAFDDEDGVAKDCGDHLC